MIERFLYFFGYLRLLDPELAPLLEEVAIHEQRPLGEVARERLLEALRQQQVVDESMATWNSLTLREKQTAALTCLGYTNEEIAHIMVISINTVKTHMRKVLAKFSLNSKAELRLALGNWDFTQWITEQNIGQPTPRDTTMPNTISEGNI